jgi:hypothetical protein
MSQVSRPFQIALVAVVGFAMVWFLALHHSSSPSSTPSASPSVAAQPQGASASTAPVHHPAVKSIEGFTRDVHKARHAVGVSENANRQVEGRSAKASGEAPAGGSSTRPQTSSIAATHPTSNTTTHSASTLPKSSSRSSKTGQSAAATQVENELQQGKTVLLLFWNPKSVDDRSVSHQLRSAVHALGSSVVVHQASASEIGNFGDITQNVHVYQTPTILIINRHKLVSSLTGFTDSFVIKQTVQEAEKQKG